MPEPQRDNLLPKEPTLLATGDRWADPLQIKLAAVWLQFLLVSPSYELARKDRAGTLGAADKARLPADFDVVLAVYDDLGDVQRVEFEEWWMDKGISYFGHPGEQPVIVPVHVLLNESSDPLTRGVARLENHINGQWRKQGRPTSLLLSIPTCLSKAEVLDRVASLLDGVPDQHRKTTTPKVKYEIQGTKHDIESYFRYLKCLYIRAEAPETKLWQIGVLAELSTTYSARIAKGAGTVDDQQALKPMASRALNRGLMMAENAARGLFPSYDTCRHAVSPVWEELDALIASRQAWEEEQEKLEA